MVAHSLSTGPARVGPNAIIQTALALRDLTGRASEVAMLEAAGLAPYAALPPRDMVAEDEAAALFRVVTDRLPPAAAVRILEEAGARTADYILAHRIPRPVQRLLAVLPKPVAARILLSAITKHAWTFAGSGTVMSSAGNPGHISIVRNPLATPGCPWHRAVFERLFRELVSRDAVVRHTACCRENAKACVFEVSLPTGRRSLIGRVATMPARD